MTSLVEEVVNERASRTERQERGGRVRDDIARKVAASGINVDARAISVTDEGKTLEVSVRWNWPVIVYQEREYLAVPLKHDRTFDVPELRCLTAWPDLLGSSSPRGP